MIDMILWLIYFVDKDLHLFELQYLTTLKTLEFWPILISFGFLMLFVIVLLYLNHLNILILNLINEMKKY